MQLTFDFSKDVQPANILNTPDSNDYHHLPASGKQVRFARQIAGRLRKPIPDAVLADRTALAAWIDAHKATMRAASRVSNHPSSKQVAFAERLARMKHRTVPDECFRDRALMSRWIDSNL